MASSIPLQIGEALQTASINRAPSPTHDINPSTTASQKEPVAISHQPPASDSSLEKYAYDDEDGLDEEEEEEEEEDVPYSVLKPVPRRASFPPLPDMRFEQSYLASISHTDSVWRIAFITIFDQVFMPLAQGMLWQLGLLGWRYWNRTAELSGNGVGARVRRWWYKTNNWKIPELMKDLGKDRKLAADMGEFYQNQSSAGD
ncbi:hypothetical protein B7494_g1239 [Chlorociboria aeruginascens]|nr:hypothetical protein B7494_g1239 [Chlorociboria aeruginascens]